MMLTPFLPNGLIDVGVLRGFIDQSYASAGFARSDVDSGAVILTGEAIKKKNAARSMNCLPRKPESLSLRDGWP